MPFEIEEKVINALVIKDKDNGVYTVYTLQKGGPIVSAPKRADAIKKFETALKLSTAARNLLYYKKANRSNTQRKRREYIGQLQKTGNIEYSDIAA